MESALRAGGRDPDLRLIETFAADAAPGRIARHLARMAGSAALLGWQCDPGALRAALPAPAPLRVRMTLDSRGAVDLTTGVLPPPTAGWRLTLADRRLDPADPWLAVKSTRRAAHDAARAALPSGIDEAIFLNARGEVCEGTISTLFFDRGQGLRTPPLACGLLPGILRAELIDQGAREEILSAGDLPRVRLWAGNSLRGLVLARLA